MIYPHLLVQNEMGEIKSVIFLIGTELERNLDIRTNLVHSC